MADGASEAAWDGDAASFKDADEYCSSCLVDANPAGKPKTKALCHLPVKKGGTLNRTAMGSAAAALAGARGGVSISAAQKKAAARKLMGYYRQINEDAPDSLKALASSGS
jgi:hypothetical protein